MAEKTNNQNSSFWQDLKLWFHNNRPYLLILTFIILILYANSIGNEFVSDDIRAIPNNGLIGTWKYVTRRFPNVFRYTLVNIIYWTCGLKPGCYRLMNVLFHIGSTLALYTLVKKLHNRTAAFVSAVLLAVHPMMVESVTWISGGPYVTYSFFVLLCLFFFITAHQKKSYHYLFLLTFFLALGTSKKAIALPALLILLLIFYPETRKNWKKLILPFSLSFAAGIFYLTQISERISFLENNYYQSISANSPLRQIPASVGKYLELLFWPDKLTLYHSEIYRVSGTGFILKIVEFSLYLSAIAAAFIFKKKKIAHWLIFFLLALAPMMTPFGISWWVAERYAYLGIFVVFGLIVSWIIKSKKIKLDSEVILAGIGLLIIIPLGIRTVVRNRDWRTQDQLFLSAERTSPSSSQNNNNLGDLYWRQGNPEKAIKHFKKAIAINPQYAAAYHNMGNVFLNTKQLEQAIGAYEQALNLSPDIWQSHRNLAVIYYQQQDYQSALDHINQALQIVPNHEQLKAMKQEILNKIESQEEGQSTDLDADSLDADSDANSEAASLNSTQAPANN